MMGLLNLIKSLLGLRDLLSNKIKLFSFLL